MRSLREGGRVRALADSGADLTPMIDVVFLLLVFFLTTLSFRVLEGKLPTFLPKDVGPSAGPVPDLVEPLTISVRETARGPQVRVGARTIAAAGTGETLRRSLSAGVAAAVRGALVGDPDLRGTLDVDPGVDYEAVVTVVDGCVAGGLTDLTFSDGTAGRTAGG